MAQYLLQINIGPVQPFIAAARRTRDLAAGSLILVEIVREVVAYLDGLGASMVFPALEGVDGQRINPREVDAPNVVLAVLPEGAPPKETAQEAKRRAISKLEGYLPDFRTGEQVDVDLAKDQLRNLLEFFSAWADLAPGYEAARKALGAQMSGRKLVRDFGPAPKGETPKPKSPLDPSFETVVPLAGDHRVAESFRTEHLLKPRESLDGIGLSKRKLQGLERFGSTRQVAALDILSRGKGSNEFSDLKRAIDQANTAPGVWIDLGDALADDLDEAIDPEDLKSIRRAAREFLRVHNDEQRPRPYYAVLHADGDGMGAYLSHLTRAEDHQRFSSCLGGFARDVAGLFPKDGFGDPAGQLVYAGGDDVVALVPARDAVRWARSVHDCFARWMEKAPGTGAKPTLTVGIAIVHSLEDLQQGVRLSVAAEHAGKEIEDKDALCIMAAPRSGGTHEFRERWDQNPDVLVEAVMGAFANDQIPRGFGGEVQRLAADMNAIGASEALVVAEFDRMCGKREKEVPAHLKPGATGSLVGWAKTPAGLETYGELLYIVHFLTRAGDEA